MKKFLMDKIYQSKTNIINLEKQEAKRTAILKKICKNNMKEYKKTKIINKTKMKMKMRSNNKSSKKKNEKRS